MANNAKGATLQSAPKTEATTQLPAKYAMPAKPSLGLNQGGLEVQQVGDKWTNKKGETKERKAFIVKVPAKPLGLSGDAALAKATEIGKAIKPAIMGRVAAFSNQEAVIVRRYSETPGKRNKMSLTLEQVSVESELAKIARTYGLTEEEVAKRLNVKPTEMPQ